MVLARFLSDSGGSLAVVGPESTRAPVEIHPWLAMILGRGQDVWAKLLQARAGARGPPLLVLWCTVRERARAKAKHS